VIAMVTVILNLAVLMVVGWWLVTTGPLSPNRSTDINVNVNVTNVEQPIKAEPPPAAKP
jgi:hypothetical protein